MRQFLILALLSLSTYNFSQKDQSLKQKINTLKKHECALIFFHPHFDNGKEKQLEEVNLLLDLDFKTLDSIFYKEKGQLRLYVFSALCKKYRSEITDKHLKTVDDKQVIKICSGQQTEEVTLREAANFLYKNSIERKEKIRSEEVFKLYQAAEELNFKGPVDFKKIISLLNTADSLEPQNPIILDARGHAKLNSKLDVEGGFTDFNNAILYSLDEQSLEIRYHNRGLSFMSSGDISSACEDWHKAGDLGKQYVEQYCNEAFDSEIHDNPNQELSLEIKLEHDTVFIIASHNPPGMSDCKLFLTIKNQNHPEITILKNNLDYGLENSESCVYLEAIFEDGKKFRFFSEGETYSYGNGKDILLKKGEKHTDYFNMTSYNHFPKPGIYKVRLALRPSKNLKGLQKTYYSNWQNLTVIKNYQIDPDKY